MLSNLFFISVLSSLIFTAHSYNSHLLCLDHQKSLLLQLKNELLFNSFNTTKLVQWNQTNECCKWYGVECDDAGYVVSLQLDQESIYGGIGESSSLFRLEYLEKLNLAYNRFNSTQIPRGIRNLTYLTHLNLSYAGFGGQVPLQLSYLTRLVSLDMSSYLNWKAESLSLEYPNLEMLVQNLTGLRELYLDGVNITSSYERRNWSQIVSSYLPHLTTLSCFDCSLSGPLAKSFWQLHSLSVLRLDNNDLSTTQFPDSFPNLSSLTTLSLVECNLKGSFPKKIFQIPTLQYLDLSFNRLLSGSLPPFPQNGSLKYVRLSLTNFSGSIPNSIGNLKNLSGIDLSFSQFTGSIPSSFANLTQLTYVDLLENLFTGSLSSTLFEGLSNLVYVNFGNNSFTGNIPHSLFGLPSLEELDLSDNHFTGKVEAFSIVNVSNIFSLDLSSNRLEGPIPDFLFQLQSLEVLSLSDNLFSGTFQLEKIQSLANLRDLDLSRNNLRVDVTNHNSSTYGLCQLQYLRLASCKVNEFPDFIKHCGMIEYLDLSNNRIGGEIPSWIHISASLRSLDLRSNQLMGELNNLPIQPESELRNLLLGNNGLSGLIPTSLCATYLDVLDLSVNKLSGIIPSCLLAMNIGVLNLGRNNLSGLIPDNFSLNCNLQYFDLNNNTLEGKIPKSIENCKRLQFMNVGNNIINDTFQCMLPTSLHVLVLHSNRFHGEVKCHKSFPGLQILDLSSNNFSGSLESINFSSWRAMVLGSDSQLGHDELGLNSTVSHFHKLEVRITIKGVEAELVKIFPYFTAIDFSCNYFQGNIPNAIGDLTSLRLLNLSHNALNGSIPKSFGKLGNLEALDLSRNQLTGAIPTELAGLTFLSFFNVSYNKLVGEIPNGRQLQTFSADFFRGNPGLCGFNLNISCSNNTVNDSDLSHKKVEEKKSEIEWEYVSTALGYVVGLGSIVWLLLFCRSFRKKYFDRIDDVVEQILDARDMRRRRRATARRRVNRNRVRRQ